MNRGEIYELLVEGSGGVNLSPKTLNLFINSGQMLLDHLADLPIHRGIHRVTVAQGTYVVTFPFLVRTIGAVRIPASGVRLVKTDYESLILDYPDPRDTTLYGTPGYYATMPVWADDPTYLTTSDYPAALGTISADTGVDMRGLLLGPTPDASYALEIHLRRFSTYLSTDESESYWSRHFPLLLVEAATYKMEKFLRNNASAVDVYKQLVEQMRLNNYDQIEDEMSEVPNFIGDKV